MTLVLHQAASHHLPNFIVAPGETDVLMFATLIFVLGSVLGIGVFYFKLHALPEHIAHKGEKVQFEIVTVLALLALFTHNHLYWVAALLLAFVRIPDFTTPLSSIAASMARIADANAPPASAEPPISSDPSTDDPKPAVAATESKEHRDV